MLLFELGNNLLNYYLGSCCANRLVSLHLVAHIGFLVFAIVPRKILRTLFAFDFIFKRREQALEDIGLMGSLSSIIRSSDWTILQEGRLIEREVILVKWRIQVIIGILLIGNE